LLWSIAADCHDRARRESKCIVVPFLIQRYAAILASTEQYRASDPVIFLLAKSAGHRPSILPSAPHGVGVKKPHSACVNGQFFGIVANTNWANIAHT
jgi:hypothetical protein